MSIRVGIIGYGNLGHGVEAALRHCTDMSLAGVFTRRNPAQISLRTAGVAAYGMEQLSKMKEQIDVLLLCGGSATDLPEMTPQLAASFHVVDSFDTHAKIPEHFAAVDAAAKTGGKVAIISAGWDPGMFSLARLYANAVLPQGQDYTFWGKGVSQGHSDAVRRIPGVLDARQYTVPVPDAVERVRKGEMPRLSTREKHTRLCYVVAAEGADREAITRAICTMPNYFDEYETTVRFITQEEMEREHAGLPHGGSVLRSGKTGWDEEFSNTIEFTLQLGSNPDFTGSVLVACARAACRMGQAGESGCKTLFDIPPALLSPLSGEELRAHLL